MVLTHAFSNLVLAESPSAQFVSDIRESLARNLQVPSIFHIKKKQDLFRKNKEVVGHLGEQDYFLWRSWQDNMGWGHAEGSCNHQCQFIESHQRCPSAQV